MRQEGKAWTDDDVRELRRLNGEGKTASAMGKIVGRSRNSIIGKLARLGLRTNSSRVKPRQEERKQNRETPRARQTRAQRLAASRPPVLVRPEDVGPGQCRFPFGDPREEGFGHCGRPTDRWPYCDEHRGLATARDRHEQKETHADEA